MARPDAVPETKPRLVQFLADGAHGDMDWLETTAPRRGDPRALWPEVRSVIMLGLNYGPQTIRSRSQQRERGAISVYAQGDDYHEVIKKRLKAVARWLVAKAGGDVKVFVDTAAVMEKPLAASAGLGWQGKHTNLVSRDHGSWLFLGAIFTTLDLPPDEAEDRPLRQLPRCLDVCPTAAFPAPYRLDARRCISYLTIEHKGPIARELRPLMGNRIYGCDDCLAVCPWNKFAQLATRRNSPARRFAGAQTRRACAARRCGVSRTVPKHRSSAPAATASCATCSSRSATPVTRRWPTKRSRGSTMHRRWCAAQRCGRSAGLTPAARRAGAAPRR